MVFLFFLGSAQDLSYRQFTIEDGLPSNHVYDIHQDQDGFLWFATENGLSRYDGAQFTNYTIFDGLPDTEILLFYEDSKARIWLVPLNGKIGYLKNGKFHNNENTKYLNQIYFDDIVTDIGEDKDGTIHFISFKNAIQLNNNNEIKKIKLNQQSRNLIKNFQGEIFYIPLNRDSLYAPILNSSDLSEVALDFNQFDNKNLHKLVYTRALTIADIFKWSKDDKAKVSEKFESNFLIHNNHIWLFGGETPLQIIETNNNKIHKIKSVKNLLNNRGIIDKDNNIWLGSAVGNGVFKFNASNSQVYKVGTHLEGSLLNSFFIDKTNGTIYVGTNDGFVNIISNNDINIKKIKPRKAGNPRVRTIGKGKFGNIWVVCDSHIEILNIRSISSTKENLNGSPKDLVINDKDNYAFVTTADGVYRFEYNENGPYNPKRLFNRRTMFIHPDSDSTFWLGTSKGLHFSTGKIDDGTFEKFNIDDPITSINHVDSTVIVATKGKGIVAIKNGKIKRITTDDGLSSNLVRSIFVNEDKSIWFSTNEGLSKLQSIDETPYSFLTLNEQNGLISNDVIDCDIMDSTIYVLCPQGISKLNLNHIDTKKTIPQIKIDQVFVNDIPRERDSISNLSHLENNITIDFSGIYFGNRKNLEYIYQLKGYHKSWQRTKSNTLLFEQLPPSQYALELYASIDNNKNTKPEVLRFEIIPAFYQRKIVQLIGTILIALLLLYFIKRQIQKEKTKSKIENRLLQLEQIALQSQMNPHFIKNSLGAIQHLMIKKDVRAANKYLIVFGELITELLKQSDQSIIKVADEIRILDLYLSIEKLRFDNNFEYSIVCNDEDILGKKIPSMMIQPLAENSILHGFRNSGNKRKNKLTIQLTPKNDYVICRVTDNGEGFINDKSLKTSFTEKEGIALNNIKERITLLSIKNTKTSFEILRSDNEGTIIQLCLPIKEDYDHSDNY